MGMEDMAEATMVDLDIAMARGMLMPSLATMEDMAEATMVDLDIAMAREMLMPSLATMEDMAEATMVDMEFALARGMLMLRLLTEYGYNMTTTLAWIKDMLPQVLLSNKNSSMLIMNSPK